MRRAPAHAGKLRLSERSAFALVFVLMLAFVVVVTMSAAQPNGHATVASTAASSPTLAVGTTGQRPAAGSAAHTRTGAAPVVATSSARLNSLLATALAPVLRQAPGRLAVGVIDENTGTEAVFHGGKAFRAAGLADVDLVAALLLQRQRADRPVSDAEAGLAAAMIQDNAGAPAAAMWGQVRAGFAAANAALGLREPRAAEWGKLRTTAADQLQLLTDLTSPNSPIGASGRDYLLGLMTDVAAGQRWGVPAAATGGSRYAVKDAWWRGVGTWAVHSTGIVQWHGQELLVAVLSDGSPTKARGVALVRSASLAAARAITGTG